MAAKGGSSIVSRESRKVRYALEFEFDSCNKNSLALLVLATLSLNDVFLLIKVKKIYS
jgi:hypothetical protein